MAKTIIVDCNKWQKVIGLTLWGLMTIGLCYSIIYGTEKYYTLEKTTHCFFQDCTTTYDPEFDGSLLDMIYFVNICNFGFIWYMIHRKIKLVEFKCKND